MRAQHLLTCLLCLLLGGALQAPVWAMAPLQGGVQVEGRMGQVTDSRGPVHQVKVSVPELGWTGHSDAQGRFSLPPHPGNPVIIRLEKPGYRPETLTWAQPRDVLVRLQALQTSRVLDTALRHLGDGSYSPYSAGAGKFQGVAQGMNFTLGFEVPSEAGPSVLTLGSVLGLDTQAARLAGQSQFHRSSTPALVMLNGKVLGWLQLNGDNVRFLVPPEALRKGNNRLEIRTGHQVRADGSVDMDDFELMLVRLDPAGGTDGEEFFSQPSSRPMDYPR